MAQDKQDGCRQGGDVVAQRDEDAKQADQDLLPGCCFSLRCPDNTDEQSVEDQGQAEKERVIYRAVIPVKSLHR